jgi:hypothetical protein
MKTFIHLFSILFISLFFSFSVFGQISVKEEMKIVQKEFHKAKKEETKIDLSFLDSIKIPPIKIEREKEEDDIIYCGFDAVSFPIFEGGMDNFYKIIRENLQFPKEGKAGRVFCFVVDTTGKMTDFEIMKSVSEENSKEVLRVMNFINENYSWKPMIDTQKRKKYKMRFAIPIIFTLEKKKKTNTEKIYEK